MWRNVSWSACCLWLDYSGGGGVTGVEGISGRHPSPRLSMMGQITWRLLFGLNRLHFRPPIPERLGKISALFSLRLFSAIRGWFAVVCGCEWRWVAVRQELILTDNGKHNGKNSQEKAYLSCTLRGLALDYNCNTFPTLWQCILDHYS